jgi:hypothetical protein
MRAEAFAEFSGVEREVIGLCIWMDFIHKCPPGLYVVKW